jgi:hypothetical protein
VNLLQFLKLRRALPKPPKARLRQAVNEWTEFITAPRDPRPVPDSIVREIKKLKADKPFPLQPGDFISSGSCIGSTRKNGGRTSLLKVLETGLSKTFQMRNWDAGSWSFHMSKMGKLIPQDEPIAMRYRGFNNMCKAHPCPTSVDLQPLAVPELGWKTRIVTKSDPILLSHAQTHRRRLFPMLVKKKHTVTSEALVDPELLTIKFRKPKRKPRSSYFIYSADFSKATDNLSQEVLLELSKALGIPTETLFSGMTVKGARVTSGTPMGMPVGWTCLSYCVFFVCSVVDRTMQFRIKGDDVIALWTAAQIQSFQTLGARIGLLVNEKTATHQTYGTFCEGDYVATWNGCTCTLQRLPTFSLRSFVNDEPLSASAVGALIRRGVLPDTLNFLQRTFHKKWIDLCIGMAVPLYGPRQFGCLDLCPRTLVSYCDTVTSRICRALNNGIPLFSERNTLQQSGPLAKGVMDVVTQIVHRVDVQYDAEQSRYADYAETRIGTALATCSYLDVLGGTALKVNPNPSPGRVVRKLKQFRKKILPKTPDPFPTTLETAQSVIRRSKPTFDSLMNVIGPKPNSTSHQVSFGFTSFVGFNP